jgi:heterodisulfide reductase subunit A
MNGTGRSADALVVGGGIAGISAAQALARAGLRVLLVEQAGKLGGKAAELACMATERCRLCSACLLEDAKACLSRESSVTVRLESTIGEARRAQGGYAIVLEDSGETWHVRSALLATGYDVFDAARKPFLGYGRLEGVVTTLELDQILRRAGDDGWSARGGPPGSVAFIQCVGSRESREGRGYCSQVCCSVALRLAGKLAHLHPDMQITMYYIDLQLAARNVSSYHEELARRVRFVQGVCGEIAQAPDGRLEVRHEDEGGATTSTFDRIVLSVGMVPSASTTRVASLFGLEAGSHGFLDAGEAPVAAVGACAFPKDIPSSMDEAREAAARIARSLTTRDAAHG